MLLGAIEVGLTVWACIRFKEAGKGWAFGLIPLGAGFLGGYFLGAILGALGIATVSLVNALGLIIDLAVIGVLVYLVVVNKPRQIPPSLPPVR